MSGKFLLLSIFILTSLYSHSQEKENTKITVTLPDTIGVYQKVKDAFVRNNFILKEIPPFDTLATYPKEHNNLYTTAFAIISGSKVTLSGRYTLKKVSYFGYNNPAKDSKRIIYYKGSKTWEQLMKVAKLVGGEISYSE